jgi:hypothetical protein
VFRQALSAAFKAHRHSVPQAPAGLPVLWEACQGGVTGLAGKAGCRDALREIRARLFQIPGREAEGQTCWEETLTTGVLAARVAQLRRACGGATFLAALVHRSGELLALKILARVELEYRMRLDTASRRDWCSTHSQELTDRVVRGWNLTAETASCALGWMKFGELADASTECAALYFGRLFAIELLQPELCVPGALDYAAAESGLNQEIVAQVRQSGAQARELIRALD